MILDVVTGVILFLSMLIAWFRGFIREVLTILGLIGAGIAALTGAPHITPYVLTWFPTKAGEDGEEPLLFGVIPYDIIAAGLSYLLIFIVVYIILSLCAHWLAKTAKESGLGALDRSLGLLFGLGRAVILIGLLFIPFHIMLSGDDKDTLEQKEAWFGDSITYPYVDYTARVMRAAIPNPLEKDGEESDSEAGEKGEEQEGEKPLSLKEMLQKQAIDSLMKTKKIIDEEKLDKEALKDLQNKEGYSDAERKAIEQLFQMQQNQEGESQQDER
jgi:membrane protein required for colicin V production